MIEFYVCDKNFQYLETLLVDETGPIPVGSSEKPIDCLGGHVPTLVDGCWVCKPKISNPLNISEIVESISRMAQKRLDDFAKTRGYDGILSACTYATDTDHKFNTEGQYCVAARGSTWRKLHEIMNEVEQGIRPMPSGYPDIEPELPELAWPN